MANYPKELAQDAVCQSHTGHMTGLWFLPTRPLRLNINKLMNIYIYIYIPLTLIIMNSMFCPYSVYMRSMLFSKKYMF